MKISEIEGWFNFSDVYDLAVEAANDQSIFVEIGAWQGKSAAYMASAIRSSGKKIKFHVVDVWRNPSATFELFSSNMCAIGVQDLIIAHQMDSVSAAKLFSDSSVTFVYIDGNHSYKGVLRDIASWYPKIINGGIIAGHDFDSNGVKRAVLKAFGDRAQKFGESSWLFH
jgi:predicted O-methyltransferase YrrM